MQAAPKPLSIFTTKTPFAPLFNIFRLQEKTRDSIVMFAVTSKLTRSDTVIGSYLSRRVFLASMTVMSVACGTESIPSAQRPLPNALSDLVADPLRFDGAWDTGFGLVSSRVRRQCSVR